MHSMTTFVGRSKRTDTISIYGKSYNIRKSQCFLFSSLHDAWRSILRNLHKRYIEYARRKEKTKIRIKMIAKNSTHVCHARFKVNVSSWYLPAMCGFSAKWEIILSSPEVRSALKAVFFFFNPSDFAGDGGRVLQKCLSIIIMFSNDFLPYIPSHLWLYGAVVVRADIWCEKIRGKKMRKKICDAEAKMHHLSDGFFSFHAVSSTAYFFCWATIELRREEWGALWWCWENCRDERCKPVETMRMLMKWGKKLFQGNLITIVDSTHASSSKFH